MPKFMTYQRAGQQKRLGLPLIRKDLKAH